MDNDRRRAHASEPRVLWGRIAVYAISLLAVFAFGLWLGGRGEASQEELASYRAEASELRRENYELEEQVAALAAGLMAPPGQDEALAEGGEEPSEGGEPAEGEEGADAEVESAAVEDPPADDVAEPEAPVDQLPPGARTYEVQAGDTLTSIAQEVYGDGSQYERIAAANGVEGQLVIGQELIIPADQ